VVPDLIGFGKSDKPKRAQAHTPELHQQSLMQLIEQLDLRNIVLVLQSPGAALGLALTEHMPERFKRVLSINPNTTSLQDPAYQRPFPDAGHRAGLQAFAAMGLHAGHHSAPNVRVQDMGPLGSDGNDANNGQDSQVALAKAVLVQCAAG
jgi:pimeloyl-ACP methyl ester carboxylesterase